MFKSLASALTLSALLAAPTASHALIYTYNASLAGFKEVPVDSGATATGTAILDYDDKNTLSLADDTYNFSMSVFGLTGGLAGTFTAASGFHIHGAANTAENGPVLVDLRTVLGSFNINSGATLLVGGNNVAAPTALFTNAPYSNLSFLAMLRANLTYINVHTALNPSGAVRGQLIEVSVIPEPSTYALWLAGLGVVGLVWRRQRPAQG